MYGVSGSKWPEQRIRVELAMWAQPDLRPGEGWRKRLRHVEFPPVTNRCSWGLLSCGLSSGMEEMMLSQLRDTRPCYEVKATS